MKSLSNLDLNLLIALSALLEQRSVTRAAEQLNLSQPALSASLGRLRRHFDDQLLTRRGNEYGLTPMAAQLRDRTRVALSSVERVFSTELEFDPKTSTREYSLVLSDYAAAVFGPDLVRLLLARSPKARLRLLSSTPSIIDRAHEELLATDLIVLPHGFLTDLPHKDLYEDSWRFIVSADNTSVGDQLTLEQLETLPWLSTYFGPTASTPAIRQLQLLGISPRVEVVTENFLTLPRLLAGTQLIAVLQSQLADALTPDMGVRTVHSPLELAPLVEAMWWHPAFNDDPEHRYIRALALKATQRLRSNGS